MLNRTVQFWAFALSVWMITGVGEAQQGGLPPEVIAYADMVLYNGKIITADDQESVVSAVAIRDGKFLAVGDDDRMLGLAGPNTEKINVQGRSVVPGFIDNHGHGSWAAASTHGVSTTTHKPGNKRLPNTALTSTFTPVAHATWTKFSPGTTSTWQSERSFWWKTT